MTGKQRRRLNWLKATKRQRRDGWLMHQIILKAWEWLNTPDSTDPQVPIDHGITSKGIIPWIIEQQKKEKEQNG